MILLQHQANDSQSEGNGADIESGLVSEEVHAPSNASNSSESRTLLLFILTWQAMYKISDNAILVLIKFLKAFLKYIAELCEFQALVDFARTIPETMYMIQKVLWLEKDNFEKYAVCPKCKSLYLLKDCVVRKLG